MADKKLKITLLKSTDRLQREPGEGGREPRAAPDPAFGDAARYAAVRGMILKVRHLVSVEAGL